MVRTQTIKCHFYRQIDFIDKSTPCNDYLFTLKFAQTLAPITINLLLENKIFSSTRMLFRCETTNEMLSCEN